MTDDGPVTEAAADMTCPGCGGFVQAGEPLFASAGGVECESCHRWPSGSA